MRSYRNIIWIGKPHKGNGFLYPYKIEENDVVYFMDKEEYELYKQENKIYKLLVYSDVDIDKVLDAIEEYGFKKYCQGCNEYQRGD